MGIGWAESHNSRSEGLESEVTVDYLGQNLKPIYMIISLLLLPIINIRLS